MGMYLPGLIFTRVNTYKGIYPGLPTFQNPKEEYFEEFLPKKRNAYALALQI